MIFSTIIWFFSTKISAPLTSLERNTRKIAEGDLTLDIEVWTNDEIGSLARSFNRMLENLNEVLHHISLASTEVYHGSKQISDSSQTLAQGSTEQASTLEELTTSLNEITNKMKANTESSKKASAFAKKVKMDTLAGSEQILRMQNAMKDSYNFV